MSPQQQRRELLSYNDERCWRQRDSGKEGNGRVSRRVVTYNHHRSTFGLLLTDLVEQHSSDFLGLLPAAVLRHIGSPFAPAKEQNAALSLVQAASSS